jgi:hypothetical protein
MDFSLLQEHTIDTYQLRDYECRVIEQVPARSLLKPQRFDLFAKLYYISNILTNRENAMRVYSDHIKAFNPDGREPGREDKHGITDFVSAFDQIITHFKEHDFDDEISVVPVDRNGVILDGAHRVAALAYFGKNVTIVRFDGVEAKCDFDYSYFKNRGLAWGVADMIALEMVKWLEQLLVACLWPSTDVKQKQMIIEMLGSQHQIAYRKDIKCDLQSLAHFVGYIYRGQEWTQNPDYVLDKASRVYGKSSLSLVMFASESSLETVLKEKNGIRQLLGKGKDSLHIADNHDETLDIATVTLDKNRQSQWMSSPTLNLFNKFSDQLKERWLILKKVQWIAFKVRVYNLISRFKS